MPTKVTPLPKAGGAFGGASAGGGGGGGGGAKYGKSKSAKHLSSRFKAATRDITAARGKGAVPALIFTTCVSLGLLILGIALVYVGDDKYIVDIMVLGGLCLVMGVGSLVVGCLYILTPIYRERKQRKQSEREKAREAQPSQARPSSIQFSAIQPNPPRTGPAQATRPQPTRGQPDPEVSHRAQAAAVLATLGQAGDGSNKGDIRNKADSHNTSSNVADNSNDSNSYVDPGMAMDETAMMQPVAGTDHSAPAGTDLYDWTTLRAAHSARTRLAPPSPPTVSVPLVDRAGTSSTVLTTVEQDSDDVSVLGDESVTPTPR